MFSSHFHAEQICLQHGEVRPGHSDWILQQKHVLPLKPSLVTINDISCRGFEQFVRSRVNVETVGVVRPVDLPQQQFQLASITGTQELTS